MNKKKEDIEKLRKFLAGITDCYKIIVTKDGCMVRVEELHNISDVIGKARKSNLHLLDCVFYTNPSNVEYCFEHEELVESFKEMLDLLEMRQYEFEGLEVDYIGNSRLKVTVNLPHNVEFFFSLGKTYGHTLAAAIAGKEKIEYYYTVNVERKELQRYYGDKS